MRKFNALLTIFILALALLHAVFGSFQMLGIGNTAWKAISWIAAALVLIHTVIGVKLTWVTLETQKKAGVSYLKENKLFWARRISGFVVMVLLLFHLTAFGYYTEEGAYRLQWFTLGKLSAQLLLLMAVAVHIISNVRPMMISFGIKGMKQWIGDILVVLSVLILFMAAAFIVYYLQWNAL